MSGDQVIRVKLERADVAGLVLHDPLLKVAPFVLALADRAEAVLKLGRGRRVQEGASIFGAGQTGDSLFFVLRGEVRLATQRDGATVELGVAGRGDCFGEREVLSPGPRGCAAHAGAEVDLVELPRAALLVKGQLPIELMAHLKELDQRRAAALDELSSFLDRW